MASRRNDSESAPSHDRDELVRHLDVFFAELRDVIQRIPRLLPAESGSGWGPFEVIGHISAWHRLTAERLGEIAAGGTGERVIDTDALNARFVSERQGLTADQLLGELVSSLGEMRDAALACPAEAFRKPSGRDEGSLAFFILASNGPEHYGEHLASLREAALLD